MSRDRLVHTLDELHSREDDYTPHPSLGVELSHIQAHLFIAPAAMGKSTQMDELSKLDPDFGGAGTFTSRSPRHDDIGKEYDYVEHSLDGLRDTIALILQKQVVQYAVHPFTHHLYGSLPRHYHKPHTTLDVLSSAVAGMRRVPFTAVNEIHLVSKPAAWLERYNARFPDGHPQRRGRAEEAIKSFLWTLERPDDKSLIVEIPEDGQQVAAAYIHDVLTGNTRHDNSPGRDLAKLGLEAARKLIALT